MRDHGKIDVITISLCVLAMVPFGNSVLLAQYYFVNSYSQPYWGAEAVCSKINLSTAAIEAFANVALPGQIMIKKPIHIKSGQDDFYLLSTVDGRPAKNSQAGNLTITNFAVFDEDLELIVSSNLPNISLFDHVTISSDTAFVRYTDYSGELARRKKGVIILRNQRPEILSRDHFPFDELLPDSIGPFKGYQRIIGNSSRFLWDVNDNGIYLLSYDTNRRNLVDSMRVASSLGYSYIFGGSLEDSVIYIFHINYNILGGPESMQKVNVDPSFLKKINMNDFSLMDSMEIDNPSADSGYVMAENGSCDKEGPYLVYYFFQGEDYRYFSPAMLFIFDTRTNQATWLRVGWR